MNKKIGLLQGILGGKKLKEIAVKQEVNGTGPLPRAPIPPPAPSRFDAVTTLSCSTFGLPPIYTIY
ncbi:MAG: hypothetical protein ACTSU9_08815 [Promethearchaeota archaeon]